MVITWRKRYENVYEHVKYVRDYHRERADHFKKEYEKVGDLGTFRLYETHSSQYISLNEVLTCMELNSK